MDSVVVVVVVGVVVVVVVLVLGAHIAESPLLKLAICNFPLAVAIHSVLEQNCASSDFLPSLMGLHPSCLI